MNICLAKERREKKNPEKDHEPILEKKNHTSAIFFFLYIIIHV